MLVDTHCHLHRQEFDLDRETVIARAKEAGVGLLLDPATDLASNRIVVDLASRTPEVYAAVGLHPHDAQELTPAALEELAALAARPKVVAIGEIGLDYYRELTPREVQKEALRKLLRLAHELSLPVVLHCRDLEITSGAASSRRSHDSELTSGAASSSRSHDSELTSGAASSRRSHDAYRDLFAILRECLTPPIKGLLHCFAGDTQVASQAAELGLYLSFAGNLTFKKADGLRAVAKEIPFDRVLLETDAPFLAPQAYRGKRNEPAYLTELVNRWAQIQDLTPEDVARVTTVNAYELFGIGPAPAPGQIAYPVRRSLYLNLTNACTDRCVFCALSTEDFWAGKGTAPVVKGHHLRIPRDPTVEEILAAAGDPGRYEEVVFCGYGEPIIRLKVLLEVARRLKAKGAKWVRLNTNGHGNLIHRRSVAQELKPVVDEVSVSLNTPDAQQYLEICRPVFGLETYGSIKQFIRECRDAGLKVVATAVAMPGVDVEAVRRVAAEELKVDYRIRTHNDLG